MQDRHFRFRSVASKLGRGVWLAASNLDAAYPSTPNKRRRVRAQNAANPRRSSVLATPAACGWPGLGCLVYRTGPTPGPSPEGEGRRWALAPPIASRWGEARVRIAIRTSCPSRYARLRDADASQHGNARVRTHYQHPRGVGMANISGQNGRREGFLPFQGHFGLRWKPFRRPEDLAKMAHHVVRKT